jgi:hypothetical protein
VLRPRANSARRRPAWCGQDGERRTQVPHNRPGRGRGPGTRRRCSPVSRSRQCIACPRHPKPMRRTRINQVCDATKSHPEVARGGQRLRRGNEAMARPIQSGGGGFVACTEGAAGADSCPASTRTDEHRRSHPGDRQADQPRWSRCPSGRQPPSRDRRRLRGRLYLPDRRYCLLWWSFSRSFHQALLQPTRPYSTECLPNLSCPKPHGAV